MYDETLNTINTTIQAVAAIGTVATAGLTYFFYTTLVRNDENREKRVAEEKIKRKMKNELWPNRTARGAIQSIGNRLAKQYPQYKELLFEAWDEVYETAMLQGPSPQTTDEFRNSLALAAPELWK